MILHDAIGYAENASRTGGTLTVTDVTPTAGSGGRRSTLRL
jgi:hypothetical protein